MERTSLDRVFAFYYVCLTSLGIAVTLVVSVYRNEPTITYIPYLLSAFICSLYIWFGQALNTSPNQKLIIIALIFGFSLSFYVYYFWGSQLVFSSLLTVNLLFVLMELGFIWSLFIYGLASLIYFHIDLSTIVKNPSREIDTYSFVFQYSMLYLFNFFVFRGLKAIEKAFNNYRIQQNEVQQRLLRLLEIDELTGCLSRFKGNQLLDQQFEQAKLHNETFALLYIDLDGFKQINDSYGHVYGDEVLKITAHRILDLLSDSQFAIRNGGDEFILCLPNIENSEEIERFKSLLLQACRAPILLDFHEVEIGLSIGIARYPHDGDNHQSLIHRADEMMNLTKKSRT